MHKALCCRSAVKQLLVLGLFNSSRRSNSHRLQLRVADLVQGVLPHGCKLLMAAYWLGLWGGQRHGALVAQHPASCTRSKRISKHISTAHDGWGLACGAAGAIQDTGL